MWKKSTPTWLRKEYDIILSSYWYGGMHNFASAHVNAKRGNSMTGMVLGELHAYQRQGRKMDYQTRVNKLMERISKEYQDVFGSKSRKLTAAFARTIVPKVGDEAHIETVHITYTELKNIVNRSMTTTLTLKRSSRDKVLIYSGKKLIHTVEEEDTGEVYVKLWTKIAKMVSYGRLFSAGPFVVLL
jgi:hypothetical protein